MFLWEKRETLYIAIYNQKLSPTLGKGVPWDVSVKRRTVAESEQVLDFAFGVKYFTPYRVKADDALRAVVGEEFCKYPSSFPEKNE